MTQAMSPSPGWDANQDLSGLELILARAATDRAFRAELLAAPHLAIASAFGIELPATFRLKFIEKEPSVDVMVVLPDLIDDGSAPADAGTGRARSRARSSPGAAVIAAMAIALGLAAPAAGQPPPEAPLSLQDAITSALTNSPDLEIAKAVQDVGAANMTSARAPFDPVFQTSLSNGRDRALSPMPGDAVSASAVKTGTVGSTLSLEKYFRSGMALSSAVSLGRADISNFPGPPINKSSAQIRAMVPLLNGRHGGLATASERAAVKTYDATVLTRQHTASRTVNAVALAYWDYVAAWKSLDVYRNSETRAETLVTETTVLVSIDERPPSDLNLLRANLSSKRAIRIDAEQRVVQARYALGLAMGLPAAELGRLGPPSTEFPGADRVDLPPATPSGPIDATALASRADLAAARTRRDGARQLWLGAEQDLLPQLDLVIGAGYTGLTRGGNLTRYLGPLFQNIAGLNSSIQIVYQPAAFRSAARGTALQTDAVYRQSVIAAEDLARTIAANAAVAIEALTRSRMALEHTEEAIRLSRVAVDIEKQKFRMGIATLFDALLSEDTLTNVLLGQINAQTRFASSIVRLRFETGTLVKAANGVATADVSEVTSVSLRDFIRR